MARKTTPTHVLLNQIELSSSASSLTFSNIPQGYGDLVLVWAGSASGTTSMLVRFNSNSGNNYSYAYAYGNGSSVEGGTGTVTYISQNFLTSAQNTAIINIMDYSATDKHKAVVSRWGSSNLSLQMAAERWASTDAINSISITANSATINSGTVFSLYGVYA